MSEHYLVKSGKFLSRVCFLMQKQANNQTNKNKGGVGKNNWAKLVTVRVLKKMCQREFNHLV